jgi:hypothetical protein
MKLFQSILFGYIRHGLTLCAGYLLAHGLIDQAGGEVLTSAGVALAGVAWSTIQKLISNYELQLAKKAVLQPLEANPASQP